VAGIALPAGAVVAAAATAGSLYFSEVAGFVPCELCWYQRILMYPLFPLLAVAALRRDRRAALYALLLAVAGIGIAAYHYQIEWFPEGAPVCTIGVPCSVIWFRLYGFVSIPFLSLVAFVAIAALAATVLWNDRRRPARSRALDR
jgi:disulfide bond formation protein DsbB